MNTLTYGSDPEFAICEIINDDYYPVPVPYFLENGFKALAIDEESKHPLLVKESNFSVIMDGVSFELTLPPVKEPKQMFDNLQSAFKWLKDFSSTYNYELVTRPTLPYNPHKWERDNNILFWQCNRFGCDRDRDAIIPDYESPEIDATNHFFRYFGGHIHLSDEDGFLYEFIEPTINLMAITVGNYCIANSKYPEDEIRRAELYGQPGRFRAQQYPNGSKGLEYRSPSNQWTTSLETVEGVFHWSAKAVEYLKNYRTDIINDYLDSTITAITTANKNLSLSIINSL
jgi:hypothetical protein